MIAFYNEDKGPLSDSINNASPLLKEKEIKQRLKDRFPTSD